MNIALIVFVYIAAVIFLLNPWSVGSFKARTKKRQSSDPYRAISLACESEACQQRAFIDGSLFLVSEAPDIPLQQCAAQNCTCRYVHHGDRRSAVDRRQLSRRAAEGEGLDRRGLRGRRKSDCPDPQIEITKT